MRILYSWLKDYVDIPETSQELADKITMAGLTVDEIFEQDGEFIYEVEITANRPDAMNHLGVAREIAAVCDRPLKPPVVKVPEQEPAAATRAAIEIVDPKLCTRYAGRVVVDVEVKPSPEWMAKRLELCGIRAINNIADITNYVLLETGQPTHAFDLDLLAGNQIIVRTALPGESLQTLDGVDRKLSDEHLVIADAARPVALAGVMGGLDTEISAKTRSVLIESAWFQPSSVRKTARGFGMHTEASHRFERGADVGATVPAADRIAALLAELAGGTVLKGVIDIYPSPADRAAISLRRARLDQLLGVSIPAAEVERILNALGFRVTRAADDWEVIPPTARLDVEREIDLIEELIRIYGYDRVANTLPKAGVPPEDPPDRRAAGALRSIAHSLGYSETVALSFMDSREAARFGRWQVAPLKNPLTELQDCMRNSAVPAMLRCLAWNLNRGEHNVRLFEIGRLYRATDSGHDEPAILTMGASGAARPASLGDPGQALDFYHLKADVAALLDTFPADISYDTEGIPAYYREGAAARISNGTKTLGFLGEIDPESLPEEKFRQPLWLAELLLDPLFAASVRETCFEPLPKVPAVHRDLSLLVPEGTPFATISSAVGKPEHLVSIEPREIFRGKQVPAGRYSLLLRTVWRKPNESLTDEEVNAYTESVVNNLTALGIEQRK
ncbi:MAG: phenylalanine--tRNA ligase subunit beta [Acidobacteria bacterium]|nr:phenylalanine--tRNA ligase subunit beta [Acidobacteriota bacterium]